MEQNVDASTPVTPVAPVVENKQKGGNGLKIATAIACVVAVCGIGFGVYGMMQSAQRDSQISDLKVEVNDLETEISNLDSKKEEVVINTETITTDPDVTSQEPNNNSSETAAILLGTILDKNDSRTVFKIGDCTADGPSVKCPVIINGKDALISYNSTDSILRLSLSNNQYCAFIQSKT